jgi:acetylornithine deacetylase/succinyl-diaminopimelate desuccinylase-like protein
LHFAVREVLEMDWDALLKEATQYLQDYIRIETVNPPGNEIEGARFLKKILERESIPCEIFEPAPGKGSLLATLKGNGLKRPILLLSHIDVVPAEKEKWEVDPFSAVIKDGFLYGRGTLDDKGMGIVTLMAFLILKREMVLLTRDVIFLAAADEETGGEWGIQWAVDAVPTLRECEFALNEGGHVMLRNDGAADRYEVSNGQKLLFQLRLKARGTSGHASMPTADNPNMKLLRALERVTSWQTPFLILPMVKEFCRKLAPQQPPRDRKFYEDIENGLRDSSFSNHFLSDPVNNAMVRDTICLTVLQAGTKVNVIPSESTALLDCRLVPGSSKETFLKEIKKRVGDEIEVEVISESLSLPPSPFGTDLYRAIEDFAARNDPGCPVVPKLLAGATDARFLREKGIIAYDFSPFRATETELLRMHGNNERIALENLKFGMRMLTEVLREVAAGN